MGTYKNALIDLESLDSIDSGYEIRKLCEFENNAESLNNLVCYTSDEITKGQIDFCTRKMEYAISTQSYIFWSSIKNGVMNSYTLREKQEEIERIAAAEREEEKEVN
jgi:hypothetical protein